MRCLERDGRHVVRAGFRDSGPGIPEAARTKIFQPFFTTKEPGTTREFERAHILKVIGLCEGNKRRAAKVLGSGPPPCTASSGTRA